MKGSEEQLLSFMDGHDKRFLIPVYQRNYDWKIQNCRQLFDDLIRVIKNDRKSHFFGSIVYVYDADGESSNHEYLIIDGQQRLTTISLLLLAMYNILDKGILKSDDPILSRKLYNVYLVDEYAPEETRIKLKPVKNDNKAFHQLFGDEDGFYKNSNLTINYEYFFNRIQKEEISVDELYKAVSRLQIISIRLNNDDNPQLIFESLNSTGVDLAEGDKIRNYVLMGQTAKKQNEFYDKYWNPIEMATNYDVSSFVRDYLSIKTHIIPSINNVYDAFKKYVVENDIEIEPLLQELFKYSKYYEILLKADSAYDEIKNKLNKDLKYAIRRLNWLETTVTRPFLIEVLRLYFNGELAQNELSEIFRITEDYLFRRNICDVATNALSKIFLNLNREIIRYDGNADNYVEKMKFTLASKQESGRYPKDEEFLNAISEKNIYNMRNKYRTYILERFENFGTKEVKNIYRGIEEGTYSIEHIMPQHLTPKWAEDLGADYEEVHTKWLHRLANLTLTAYNSNYSNDSFIVKRDLVDKETGEGIGFSNSGLRMNQWLGQQSKWTLEEILKRNDLLIERTKKIWPYVDTDFMPKEKPMESVSLDDDVDLTGRLISKFTYKGVEQPVTSWTEAYQKILKILHQQDESVLTALAYSDDNNEELSSHVSTKKDTFSSCTEIDDGIYVWTGLGTRYKISNLQKFFKKYGADPQDLVFYLKDESKDNNKKVQGGRFELRKRYWIFALPVIQESFKTSSSAQDCFANIHPGTDNWITSSVGIGGFSVSCIANYDQARIEFNMNKAKRDDNKAAFDLLYSHKEDIEKILGSELNWDSSDQSNFTRISICSKEVSIADETDWKVMAKFHAEWSRKLCDVLLPYLKSIY